MLILGGMNRSDDPQDQDSIHPEILIASDEGGIPMESSVGLVLADKSLPPHLLTIPLNGPVVFPTLMAPVMIHLPRFIETAEEVIGKNRTIALLMPKEGDARADLQSSDLYSHGVVAKIIKRLKMPDGSINLLVQSIKRIRVKKVLAEKPHIVVEPEYLEDVVEQSDRMDALSRAVLSQVKLLSEVNPFFTDELRVAMINASGPGAVSDLVSFALSLPREEAQEFLETLSVRDRLEKLLVILKKEQDLADLQKKIQDDVNSKLNSMQREFFLKEQLKVIKKELGMEEDGKDKSSRTFRERIKEAKMPSSVEKIAYEELEKFETLSEQSPEYNVSRTYLETLCALPWTKETQDHLNLDDAQKILDEDHYGLEKVKDRIIEFLAVRQLLDENPSEEQKNKGSIICLVGPPGVGKTSIGKSIARTMGREFYRFSLGGMRDEAEIKGHRRTYIGAMPGKVLQAVRRAGTKNPVLMLDEIDKLGQSFQGDPASALLEVLDPEQNSSFIDHYLDVPFDLSDVLFIATANSVSQIPSPLLDRMEVIEIPGYTLEEKEKIASKYVIPKVLKKNGLKPSELKLTRPALRKIMSDYAREPGLRSLQQMVDRIARKAAAQVVRKRLKKRRGKPTGPISIRPEHLQEWLGPKRFYNEVSERITDPGVVVGLAWTSMGGDILFIESTRVPSGKSSSGGDLKLTGQMGDVMSESANIAWSYVKGLVEPQSYEGSTLHLHIPAGAIPKDGPSAGISMATALYSLLTGRRAKQRIAMTGELSLKGKVLPVGGIKEKVLAAKRVGIHTVILPELNKKDLKEIPAYALKGIKIHWVSRVEDVFRLALNR